MGSSSLSSESSAMMVLAESRLCSTVPFPRQLHSSRSSASVSLLPISEKHTSLTPARQCPEGEDVTELLS